MVQGDKLPAKPDSVPKKIAALEAIRKKVGSTNGTENSQQLTLEATALDQAWKKFIDHLKKSKNSAWQSFEMAELKIVDNTCFEAVVTNNINQKFLELERNKACEFLQKELNNRLLKFKIVLVESQQPKLMKDLPLSSKEQYQKMVENFPLVKELKDRLKLELDY
jgi:DNA polymerase-3 subunit gamma/tau